MASHDRRPAPPATRPLGTTIAALLILVCIACALPGAPGVAHAQGGASLRFFGTGPADLDRVKIPLGALSNGQITSSRPVNVGGDFTLEFWMKASAAENSAPACDQSGWYYGNIIVDRDVDGAGDYGDYGIAICNQRLVFGVNAAGDDRLLVSQVVVADGAWHHVAATRDDGGAIALYVDGQPAGSRSGPGGRIDYRTNRPTSQPNSDPYLVLGAEKHDYPGSRYYSGWLDDLRISSMVRYSGAFSRPTGPHSADAGTVALYRFDEGAGTSIGDGAGASGGELKPRAGGAGQHWSSDTPFSGPPPSPSPQATAQPTPTVTATPGGPAAGNRALSFGGDDRARLGAALPGLSGSHTFELWVNPASASQTSVLAATTDETAGWALELSGGRPVWWVRTAAGEWRSVSHSAALPANAWSHVAVTYSASGQSARLFVNGAASASVAVGAISAGPQFELGALSPHAFFQGQLDEVRISSRVRYSASFTPPAGAFSPDSATVALYSLDEGAGQSAADRSGNGYTLTLGDRPDGDGADPAWSSSAAPTR